MNSIEARNYAVRRIVAQVCDRSFGGTKEATTIRALDLIGAHEDEISWLIEKQLGVKVPPIEWTHFVTVGDLIRFVEIHAQKEVGAE